MSCDACTAALANPLSGLYRANCTGCKTRALATTMVFFEAVQKKGITPAYQAVLDAEFGTDQPAQAIRHHQVKTWAKRQRKAL